MMPEKMHYAFSKRATAGHIYSLDNPFPVTGNMDIDLFWRYGVGFDDGLATRASGGRLRVLNREKTGTHSNVNINTLQKVPELYPLQVGATYAFYRPEDRTADYARTKIDRRAIRQRASLTARTASLKISDR
jgi:hypothetical protein